VYIRPPQTPRRCRVPESWVRAPNLQSTEFFCRFFRSGFYSGDIRHCSGSLLKDLEVTTLMILMKSPGYRVVVVVVGEIGRLFTLLCLNTAVGIQKQCHRHCHMVLEGRRLRTERRLKYLFLF